MAAGKKKYTLLPEHRAQLKPWADRWIANAMSTQPMDDAERVLMREAICRLYRAAKLTPPPDARIVFVPSPFVARVAAGFAAAIWWDRRRSIASARLAMDATRDATMVATWAATEAVTWDATRVATEDATRAATWDATRAATRDATRVATGAATEDATRAATWDATGATQDAADNWYRGMGGIIAMARALCPPRLVKVAIACAYHADRFWDGGNQWSGYPAFLSFFRHVAHLPLDYSEWDAYEQAALHSGPRLMHEQFCIVSDRPRVLTVDDQSRPHHASGPFCRWADGTALYAWHGVRVPWWVIEQPSRITPAVIQQQENAEIRRAMIERIGWDVWLEQSGARPVQQDAYGHLYRTELDGARIGVVVVTNSTPEADGSRKRYALLVPAEHETAQAAVASTFGLSAAQYAPCVET